MDDTTLFGRASGTGAGSLRCWRDDPGDWRSFGEYLLCVEMVTTKAGLDHFSQTRSAITNHGRCLGHFS